MRYLEFSMDTMHYTILYEGLVVAQRGLDNTEVRVMGSILDKLEKLGRPKIENNRAIFAQTEDGVVAFEDAEYKLINEMLASVKWATKSSRDVTKLLDHVANAPTVEPKVVER